MHLCSLLALLASALGLFGVAKVGLKPFQTSSARQPEGPDQYHYDHDHMKFKQHGSWHQEKPWAQQRWETMMWKRRECKTKCMGDESCSEQCPKPWFFLREKCDAAKPIWDCHKQCGRDHACHEKCPLPQCSKAAEKVKRALQCHGKCGDDRECHHNCGRPFSEFQAVCKSFDEVSSCHKVCVHGDHACHAKCPKISWPAATGNQHYDHDHMKFEQQGSWHNHEHGSWDGHKHDSWHNRTHGDWHHHGHDHREHHHHHGHDHRERHHHGNSSFQHHEHHHADFSLHHTEDQHHGFHHHENHHHGNSGFHGHKHHHDGHSSSHNHEHRHDGNSKFGPHEHYGAKHEHHHAHHAHEHVGEQYVVV